MSRQVKEPAAMIVYFLLILYFAGVCIKLNT